MSLITVERVSKTFRTSGGPKLVRDHIRDRFQRRTKDGLFYALKDVSFCVEPRESVAVIGGNGAGKSTLLSLIAGVTEPDEGTVRVRGRVSPLLELGSGFHPDLTGEENVYLNAALLGYSARGAREKFAAIVEYADIGSFIYQTLRTYSLGMTMRLAFAVAIHVEPAILIIDEVLAVGDAGFQAKCFETIHELRKSGTTLLFVSHNPVLVQALCDKAIWLERGEVAMQGEAGYVTNAYTRYITSDHKIAPAPSTQPVTVPDPPSASVRAGENEESHLTSGGKEDR